MIKLQKLNDRIYYLPYEQINDRPTITYIRGDNYAIAIDAGNSRKHVELFYSELKENNLPLPSLTIITHWHWDHTFGLKYINGLSLSTKKTYDKLEEVRKWKWTIKDMQDREKTNKDIPFCNEHILVEYSNLDEIEVINTDIQIEKETILDLGGIKIQIIPFPSTHCDDSLVVYIKDLSTLIVGDADGADFYNGEIYDKGKIQRQCDFYNSLDYKTHIFSHFDITSKQDIIKMLEEEYNK